MSTPNVSPIAFHSRSSFTNWLHNYNLKDRDAVSPFLNILNQNIQWVNKKCHIEVLFNLRQCVWYTRTQGLLADIQNVSENILKRFAALGRFEEVKDVIERSPLPLRVHQIYVEITNKCFSLKNSIRSRRATLNLILRQIRTIQKEFNKSTSKRGKSRIYHKLRPLKKQRDGCYADISEFKIKLNNLSKIHEYLSLFDGPHFISTNHVRRIVCQRGNPPEGFAPREGLLLSMRRLNISIVKSVKCGGGIFHLSQTFFFRNKFHDRPLIFFFLQLRGNYESRLIWLSGSQGIWRRVDKVFRDWIGKSVRGEEGIAIPFKVEKIASKIYQRDLQHNGPLTLPDEKNGEGERFLKYLIDWSRHGTGPRTRINGQQVFKTNSPHHPYTPVGAASLGEDEDDEIEFGPSSLPNHPKDNDFRKRDNIEFDFQRAKELYEFQSPIYGDLTAVVVPSKSDKYKFLFLENASGHVFLAGAEVKNASITDQGLKERWVNLNKLSLPLNEYPTQFLPRHNQTPFMVKFYTEQDFQAQNPRYVLAWNYLRKMRPIRAYCHNYKKGKVPPRLK